MEAAAAPPCRVLSISQSHRYGICKTSTMVLATSSLGTPPGQEWSGWQQARGTPSASWTANSLNGSALSARSSSRVRRRVAKPSPQTRRQLLLPTRHRSGCPRHGQHRPGLLLDSPRPVLLDEWQVVPTLWDHVRRAVDDRAPTKGLYILTGSATPSEDVNRHSGAGRIAIIQMRPMSLMESGHATGAASLEAVLAGDNVTAPDSGLTIPDIIDRICIGGWPALLEATSKDAGHGCATTSTRSFWSTSKNWAYGDVTQKTSVDCCTH